MGGPENPKGRTIPELICARTEMALLSHNATPNSLGFGASNDGSLLAVHAIFPKPGYTLTSFRGTQHMLALYDKI
jgi:hypothetical protein